MLKEKSSQWARLKLLLLLPFGILSVYAFARTQMNVPVNEPTDLFTAYESNHFFQETQETTKINEPDEPKPPALLQQKPDYIPDYYLVDGEKCSIEQYNELVRNSIRLDDMQYMPFVKGKIVNIQIVYTTGLKSLEYYREMYVDGKRPGRSHVYFVIDGVKNEYNGQLWRAHTVKNDYNGQFWELSARIFSDKDKAESYIKQHDLQHGGIRAVECQFVAKDGSQSSEVWYSLIIPPPPPPSQ
jgi:hypothetical protein